LWTVTTAPDAQPARLSPDHGPTRAVGRYVVSPDGAHVAYLVGAAAGVPELWLVAVANPSAARLVPLPPGTLNVETIQLMRFSPDSRALFFGVFLTPARAHLLRVAVDNTSPPAFIYPLAGEAGNASSFVIAPDGSYVVVRDGNLNRVTVADPSVRVTLNAALPAGQILSGFSADATATRFVYQTTGPDLATAADDRLWRSDLASPGVSWLLLDGDPARAGPMFIESLRPDGNALLATSWGGNESYRQHDLAEISIAPADGQIRLLNAPAPSGARTQNAGQYLDEDTIIFTQRARNQPGRVFEVRGSDFANPVELAEPGFSGQGLKFSPDDSMLAFLHTREAVGDPGHYGVLVNRTAPGALWRVTPPSPGSTGFEMVVLTERQ
jgi:hypothetical protein